MLLRGGCMPSNLLPCLMADREKTVILKENNFNFGETTYLKIGFFARRETVSCNLIIIMEMKKQIILTFILALVTFGFLNAQSKLTNEFFHRQGQEIIHPDGNKFQIKGAARVEANLTQEELAEKTGTKKSYISRIERGLSDIQISTYYKLIELGLGKHLNISIG